jgi:arabinan endo-1,5-alpha-L-arabinosidase
MRKSSLVKAMACFMAATMAVTFVPSANVTNGVSVVASAETGVTVPAPAAKFTFGDNKLKDSVSGESATLTGKLITDTSDKTDAVYKDGALFLDGTYGVKLPKTAVPTGKNYTISYTTTANVSTIHTSQIFLGTSNPANWASFGRGNTADDGTYTIWTDNETDNKNSVGSWNSEGEKGASNAQPNGEKHTFTIVVEDEYYTIYRDSQVIVDKIKAMSCVLDSTSEMYLGVNAWDDPYKGTIENFEVYNEALTAAQVKAITPIVNCT